MPRPKLLIATRNPGKMREYRQLLRDAPFKLVSLDDLGIAEEVEETSDTFDENAGLKARTYGALGGILTLADDSGLEVDALGGEPGVFSSRYGEKSPLTPLYERGGQGGLYEKGGEGIPPSAHMSDQDRVALLLRNLDGVPWEQRTARFRCVLAIAAPSGRASTNEASTDAHSMKEAHPDPHLEKGDSEIPPRPPFVKGGWGDFAPDVTLLVGSVAGMIQYEPAGDEGFGYDPVFYLPSYGKTMGQLPLEEKNRISHRADAARKAAAVLQGLAES